MDEEQVRDRTPLALFYSYVDQDEVLLFELERHLRGLEREGMITSWHHRKIRPGDDAKQVSNERFEAAQLILLLISSDFLALDAAHEEMQQALRRHQAGQAHVIPLLLRPVGWERTPIAQFYQVLPRNGQPVTTWADHDQAFVHVAKEIRLIVEQQIGADPSSQPYISPFPFVFLSYARTDLNVAERVQNSLMAQEITGWIDQRILPSGSPKDGRLREAIRNASAVIVVATPDTRRASSVKAELQIAEMYRRTTYILWLGGSQLSEVVPTGYHGFPCFDARGQRYEEGLAELLQAFREQMVPSLAGDLPVKEVISPPATPRNPYKGLQAFKQEDAQDFFGRERLIGELVEKVHQMLAPSPLGEVVARLLTVVGGSGSGKSSVVMAGLLPKLQQGVLDNSQHWIYLAPIVPGQHPLEALTLTLSPLFPARSLKSIQEGLEGDTTWGLHLLLTTYVQQTAVKVVLLVDQFEELFTQTSTEERRHFLDLLLTAVTEPDGPLVAIITLRADFSDRPLQYPELGRLVEARRVTAYPLETQDLWAVIEQPAQLPDVQLTFEEDLVGDLLFEVQGQIGALPLLQFTLDQLFQRRMGQTLTRRAYLEIGGVRGALANHAEKTYQSLPTPAHQKLARALFLRLISPGTVAQDVTKRRVPLSALTVTDPEETDMLARVTQDFMQARLLTTNTVYETATIEVSHEALIDTWSRLAEWLHKARDDIHRQQAIGEDAAEWLRRGEPIDRLYLGSQLKEALAWRETNIPNLDEDRFLQASQRRERQQRQRTTRRLLLTGLVVGAGMAAVGGLVYILRPSAPSPSLGLPYPYKGHTGAVRSVAWSPDSNRIASAGDDKTVLVWDGTNGTTLITYKGHSMGVSSVAWSPDSKRIASAGDDSAVQVWDGSNGTTLITYKGHSVGVSSVAWSPDGKRIASAGGDWTVHVWDASSGTTLTTYKGYGSASSIAWSPDGKRIAAGDSRTVQVWDASSSGAPLFTYKGRISAVSSVAWSPNGTSIASAGNDNAVDVWDASSGTPLFSCNGHSDRIRSIAWSPDSKHIASASSDHTVQVWDASSGTPLATYNGHVGDVRGVTWSPEGKRIASGGWDKTVWVWDASSRNIPLLAYKEHTDRILSVVWSPDGKQIASASSDHTVQVWDASNGHTIDVRDTDHSRFIIGIVWSLNGKSVVVASEDSTARVQDASSSDISPLTDKEYSVAWSPDGKRLASSGSDKTVQISDTSSGAPLLTCKGHTDRIWSIAWSPDSKRIASGSGDKTVQVWDTSSGASLLTYKGHTDQIWSIAWSPDGKRIASGSGDKTVQVWDASSGAPLLTYKGHTSTVASVVWSPDGERIASAGNDSTVQVWDGRRGTLLLTYRGHTEGVKSAAWSPDGKHIASAAGRDKTIHVWEAVA